VPFEPVREPLPPTRVWVDPQSQYLERLAERLLANRIVLAAGLLDDAAAARLTAQLLALEADSHDPVRLELQNLRAELPAALAVMGMAEVMRTPLRGCVSGEITGAALGVLAACANRSGYPNATFTLAEPRMAFGGTATAVAAREQEVTRMTDRLYFKLADVTGREVDEIRDDFRRGRSLTTAQAIGYGLIHDHATPDR
jgi:ATP-dependent Clp protease, protease subunit